MQVNPNASEKPWRMVLGGCVGLVLLVCGGGFAFLFAPQRWESVEIPDASQPVTLRLTTSSRSIPSGITVWIEGDIDGEGRFWAANWEPERIAGKVNERRYHDYFANEIEFRYEPVNARGGRLAVRYQFH